MLTFVCLKGLSRFLVGMVSAYWQCQDACGFSVDAFTPNLVVFIQGGWLNLQKNND